MEEIDDSKEKVKENVKARILQIMEREGLTAGAFAENIKVAQATISQILRGRNMPSTEVLIRLHQRYPDINLDWLITGEGTMSSEAPALATPQGMESDYPLFAENPINASGGTGEPRNRKEMASEKGQYADNIPVKQEIIYRETPPKKITEIRVFFEDNTFQVFKPEK